LGSSAKEMENTVKKELAETRDQVKILKESTAKVRQSE
jgi:hypothetical protein